MSEKKRPLEGLEHMRPAPTDTEQDRPEKTREVPAGFPIPVEARPETTLEPTTPLSKVIKSQREETIVPGGTLVGETGDAIIKEMRGVTGEQQPKKIEQRSSNVIVNLPPAPGSTPDHEPVNTPELTPPEPRDPGIPDRFAGSDTLELDTKQKTFARGVHTDLSGISTRERSPLLTGDTPDLRLPPGMRRRPTPPRTEPTPPPSWRNLWGLLKPKK